MRKKNWVRSGKCQIIFFIFNYEPYYYICGEYGWISGQPKLCFFFEVGILYKVYKIFFAQFFRGLCCAFRFGLLSKLFVFLFSNINSLCPTELYLNFDTKIPTEMMWYIFSKEIITHKIKSQFNLIWLEKQYHLLNRLY